MHLLRCFPLFFLMLATTLTAKDRDEDKLPTLSPERVAEIAGWLKEGNGRQRDFYTPPYADRAYWDDLGSRLETKDIIAEAAEIEGTEPPKITRELFDAYAKTGDRTDYELVFSERTNRLGTLTYAEGFVWDGSRLPAIERELAAILDEFSWAVPAHIPAGVTEEEALRRVDLAASARAWSLATVDYLLGDKLQPETRARIRQEVRARVWKPVLERIHAGNLRNFGWMTGRNNWNAICNGGVMGSALLLSDSVEEKALLIAAFERFTQSYIDSFGPDGFCEEGIGYWSYGYGHYTMSSELIRLVTGGRLDLLSGEAQKRIAVFDVRWQLTPGVYPPFGDASVQTRIPTQLHDFATLRYGGSGGLAGSRPSVSVHRHPLGAQLYSMPFRVSQPYPQPGSPEAEAIEKAKASPALRDSFPEGGALVVRATEPGKGLSAAFKGGHNGQSHNHNDLGSFVVQNGSDLVLTDLGADTYVKDTFGPRRYTSGVMNSYGHPVPRVAGQLQRKGSGAVARTVREEFSEERDIWEIDLTSAYQVPALEKLTRTFVFERGGKGRVEIIDHVVFRKGEPQTFGTALILRPQQKMESPTANTFQVRASRRSEPLEVSWSATALPQGELLLKEDPVYGIVPNQAPRGYRLGFDFDRPVQEATIRTVIAPAP